MKSLLPCRSSGFLKTTSRALLTLCTIATLRAHADVTFEKSEQKVAIKIDGQLFTEYRFSGAPHVYFYPVLGPGGARMTRSYPMESPEGEEHDHPHHRSLWFAHGNVNGIDFWTEPATHKAAPKIPLGRIEHEKFLTFQAGPDQGLLSDRLRWVAPDGTIILHSTQTLRVYATHGSKHIFDLEYTLDAGPNDVRFGDTKEGTMAIRIAESMRLVRQDKSSGGTILNSEGQTGKEVWGKRAKWVTMAGPVDGKPLGIAIFDHPNNPRFPTRWHARDYGLFAANPFCEAEMDKTQKKGSGDFLLPAGKSTTFRYRFYFYSGDPQDAKLAEHWNQFSESKP